MSEDALLEAIMMTRQQIDFLWQFFVTVHIAIFALLFIYDRVVEGLNMFARAFAVSGVALFEWVNGNAISNAYRLLDGLLGQFRVQMRNVSLEPGLAKELLDASFADRPTLVMITHSMAFAIVILAFLSQNFIQAKKRVGS